MTFGEVLSYLAVWSIVGSIAFSVFVVLAFRTGIVFTARNEEGSLKEKIPLRGYLAMMGFMFCIVGFMVLANFIGLSRKGYVLSFGALFSLNLALFLILFLFDTIVIDGLVIGYWRPGFFDLPDAMGWDSMKKHMLKSIPAGTVFGLVISAISTVIPFFALM